MSNTQPIICIAGCAGSGKDMLCEVLTHLIPGTQRFALADALKADVRDFCMEKYDIDPVNCSREDKEKIRDFLVFHGHIRRQQSEGRYWTNLLAPVIHASSAPLRVVTDVRYTIFDKDEHYWAKNELGATLVHVRTYVTTPTGERVYVEPPNEHERRNDPVLQKVADYRLEWPKIGGERDTIRAALLPYGRELLAFIEKRIKKNF